MPKVKIGLIEIMFVTIPKSKPKPVLRHELCGVHARPQCGRSLEEPAQRAFRCEIQPAFMSHR
jgi:hypothetical protein